MNAARFTTGYVRLVGQELAPRKCALMSTSRAVRKEMKDWPLTEEGDGWTVKLDVRGLGGHLDTTFRGWSATLAARVRLVIGRLVLICVLPLDVHLFLQLRACASCGLLFVGLSGLSVSV